MAEKVVDIHKCPELTIEEIEKRPVEPQDSGAFVS